MSGSDLASLVGEQLNGVCFVMDYVEFTFNGPILRALTPPVVRTACRDLSFGEPGSFEALYSLIGAQVSRVIESDDELGLIFEDGRQVIIPLRDELRSGPEAAHFVPGPDAPIVVW